MYYNSTSQTGENLKSYNAAALTQDETVLAICKTFKKPFSVKDVVNNYPNSTTPITSIRRSINTLCHKQNEIEATGKNTPGLYGRPEAQYIIKTTTNA